MSVILALAVAATAPSNEAQQTVARLLEAAHEESQTAFDAVAPNAGFMVGDVGQPLKMRDIPSCKVFSMVGGDRGDPVMWGHEFLKGDSRQLMAVTVNFSCHGPYALTFGVEQGRIVTGYVSRFAERHTHG